ncbi:MAG: single-stranded DNA-binding protein [Patescibacteria group bacterium]|nr:single-stranded DNA-binding protein [Patescibacteria group bacterium]
MNLNKVFLLGNLTSDPELKNLPSGQQVCSFGMASNKVWTDKETGEKKRKAEFHNIVAWRNLATIASQYLKKGGLVFVEGHLTTRSWDDASGNKKYKTEIIADNIQLGPRPTGTGQASPYPVKEEKTDSTEKAEKPSEDSKEKASSEEIPTIEEGHDINLDEIPF